VVCGYSCIRSTVLYNDMDLLLTLCFLFLVSAPVSGNFQRTGRANLQSSSVLYIQRMVLVYISYPMSSKRCQDSLVSIVTSLRAGRPYSIPGKGRDLSSSSQHPDRFWVPCNFPCNACQDSFTGDKIARV
jgi:hypothetical protein